MPPTSPQPAVASQRPWQGTIVSVPTGTGTGAGVPDQPDATDAGSAGFGVSPGSSPGYYPNPALPGSAPGRS